MVTPRSGAGFAAHSAEAALVSYFLSATSLIILRIGIFTNYRVGSSSSIKVWETLLSRAERQLADADVALVGRAACNTITFTDRRNDDSE